MYKTVAEFLDRAIARQVCRILNEHERQRIAYEGYERTRNLVLKHNRGLYRKQRALKSPQVMALRAARALKKFKQENSNG